MQFSLGWIILLTAMVTVNEVWRPCEEWWAFTIWKESHTSL